MLAVLVLVSVLMVAGTVALVPMSEAFLQVRRNSDLAQSTAFAMTRVAREFTSISNVVDGAERTITYDHLDHASVVHRRTLAWGGVSGGPLTLDGVPLLDGVGALQFRYLELPDGSPRSTWSPGCRLIETEIRMVGAPHIFTLRIRPRNVRAQE